MHRAVFVSCHTCAGFSVTAPRHSTVVPSFTSNTDSSCSNTEQTLSGTAFLHVRWRMKISLLVRASKRAGERLCECVLVSTVAVVAACRVVTPNVCTESAWSIELIGREVNWFVFCPRCAAPPCSTAPHCPWRVYTCLHGVNRPWGHAAIRTPQSGGTRVKTIRFNCRDWYCIQCVDKVQWTACFTFHQTAPVSVLSNPCISWYVTCSIQTHTHIRHLFYVCTTPLTL